MHQLFVLILHKHMQLMHIYFYVELHKGIQILYRRIQMLWSCKLGLFLHDIPDIFGMVRYEVMHGRYLDDGFLVNHGFW